AMTVNGARGATKKAVLQAVGLPENHSLRKLNGLQASLIAELDRPHLLAGATPSIVRARRSLDLNKAFLAKTRKFYRSTAGAFELADPRFALARISASSNDEARGGRGTLLTRLRRDTRR